MSGELAASRTALAAALAAEGLELPTPGVPPTPPFVLIRPGDPWLVPSTLGQGQREVTWSVVLVAGLATVDAALDTLVGMAEAAILALDGLTGWTAPRSARAITLDLHGTLYLASELTPIGTLVLVTA